MTPKEAITLHRTANSNINCYRITPKLLFAKPLTEDEIEFCLAMDKAFNEATPSTEKFVVYRGAPDTKVSYSPYSAFLSTSRDITEAAHFANFETSVIFRIEIPSGVPFLNISAQNAQNEITLEQNEILLPRDLKFKISDWDPLNHLDENQNCVLQMILQGKIVRFLNLQIQLN